MKEYVKQKKKMDNVNFKHEETIKNLTIRDFFAGLCAANIIGDSNPFLIEYAEIAEKSYRMADKLLKERNNT